jgi:hypothetical protein
VATEQSDSSYGFGIRVGFVLIVLDWGGEDEMVDHVVVMLDSDHVPCVGAGVRLCAAADAAYPFADRR